MAESLSQEQGIGPMGSIWIARRLIVCVGTKFLREAGELLNGACVAGDCQ